MNIYPEIDTKDHPELQELEKKKREAKQKSFYAISAFFMKHVPHNGHVSENFYSLAYSIKEDLEHRLELQHLPDGVIVTFICNETSGRTFIVSGYPNRNLRVAFKDSEVDMSPDFVQLVKTKATHFQKMEDQRVLERAVEQKRSSLEHSISTTERMTEEFINP